MRDPSGSFTHFGCGGTSAQGLPTDALYQVLGVEVKAKVAACQPDVVLMDIDMTSVSGIDAVRTLNAERPELPIMMLATFGDEDRVYNSLRAGVVGSLLKNNDPAAVLDAIREVHARGAPMSPSIARKLLFISNDPKQRPRSRISAWVRVRRKCSTDLSVDQATR